MARTGTNCSFASLGWCVNAACSQCGMSYLIGYSDYCDCMRSMTGCRYSRDANKEESTDRSIGSE